MPKSAEELNAYMKKYLKKRYNERKAEALDRLGGKCVICGAVDELEVDHIDRTQKSMPFSRMYVVLRERFEEELAKCQLLCNRCHIEKTIDERGHNRRTEHGTFACYRHMKCRCEACRKACRDHSRAYRARKKKMGLVRRNNKWVASSNGSSS